MDYITPYMMKKLQDVGFSYPDFEHHLNYGMVYAYRGSEHFIGANCDSDFSDEDRAAAREGLWLPDSDQLLSWLQSNGFDLSIALDSQQPRYSISAKDLHNSACYTGGGYPLAFALHKVIYKICKSGRRSYIPEKLLQLEIICDAQGSE